MSYYRVKAYCGHVGAGKHQLRTFAIEADSATDAIMHARKFPAVKHNKARTIQEVVEITKEEFDRLMCKSAYDDT